MIVYKICARVTPFKTVSMWAEGEWKTSYTIGKTTYPPRGGLFAFGDFEHALRFSGRPMESKYLVIFECEAEPCEEQPTTVAGYAQFPKDLEDYWAGVWNGLTTISPPKGTILCKWIKPFRDVTPGGGDESI